MHDKPSFVVLADDWGSHPSSCQHLFRRIAQRYRTLWVNTVGLRPPRFEADDAIRAVRKMRRWVAGEPDDMQPRVNERLDLHVISPPMIPWSRPPIARKLQRAHLQRTVLAATTRLGMHQPVLVTTVPNGVEVCGALGERSVVYYCVDDFTHWPGVDTRMAREMEEDLLDRANVVIATSETLRTTRTRGGRVPYLLRHGVDVAHFAKASDPATAPWPGVRRERPVMGYVGLIDERTDAILLATAARLRPGWDFVLVGPVDRVPDALRRVSNVRIVPPVSYEDVPRVLAAFDVAILPYCKSTLTSAINPLKFREYLASGRPVVSTTLPEIASFAESVHFADTPAAFVHACETARTSRRSDVPALRARLASESWEARADEFLRWSLGERTSFEFGTQQAVAP